MIQDIDIARNEFKNYKWFDVLAILAMVVTTIVTFGLDKAMLIGFGLYIVFQILRGEIKKVNLYLLGSAILLLLGLASSNFFLASSSRNNLFFAFILF